MRIRDFGGSRLCLASALCFAAACFAKQFYTAQSGGFQLGDLLFIGSAGLVLLSFAFHEDGNILLKTAKEDWLLILYFGCIIVINSIYTLIDPCTDFLLHTAYYIYIGLVIIAFCGLLAYDAFFTVLRTALCCTLSFQCLVFLLGKGKDEVTVNGEGILGTFNDPNQCAFYMFAAFLLLYLIRVLTGEGHPLLWFFVVLFVIVKTGSMGNFLGMMLFAYFWCLLRAFRFRGWKKWLIGGGLIFALLAALVFVYLVASGRAMTGALNNRFTYKIVLKIQRFIGLDGSFSVSAFVHDRAWDMLVEDPQYFLFGSGEGDWSRFGDGTHEVHNSVLGPMYYYGVGPWLLWAVWYLVKLRRIRTELIPVYISLFAESFLLMNCRQPFFWMILLLAGIPQAKKTHISFISPCLPGGQTQNE